MKDFSRRYNNLRNVGDRRRQLRGNASPPEKRLWRHLRGSQLQNTKFRRQHSIGSYILDFYCPAKRLAIEIDGGTHDNPTAYIYDIRRTSYLENFGIVVLRFSNYDVMNNLEGVLMEINKYI